MTSTACDDQLSSPPPEGILVSDNTKFPEQKALPCPFCGAQMHINEFGHIGHPPVKCLIIALLYMCNRQDVSQNVNLLELWNTRVKP
jgi:hypothetical protein